MSAKNTIKDNRGIKKEEPTKTNPPKEEALSHKPTFGDTSERPGIEQEEPEKDRSTKVDEAPEPPNPAIQPSTATEDKTAPGARIMGEKAQENLDNIAELAEGGGAERANLSEPANEEAAADAQTEENQNDGASEADAEDHNMSEEVKDQLEDLTDLQGSGPDPDRVQREMHQPTTEDQFRAPQTRPHTIDPDTGQVHYAGEVESLPGGTAANEGKAA